MEKVSNRLGGDIFAKHSLLVPRYLPRLTPISDKGVTWLHDHMPNQFWGNVHIDSTTTINRVFPEARRSGPGAVMVEDELPNSKEEEATQTDDQYMPEYDQQTNPLGQPVLTPHTTHAEPDSITHTANHWPYTMRKSYAGQEGESRVAATAKISSNELKNKGVNTEW